MGKRLTVGVLSAVIAAGALAVGVALPAAGSSGNSDQHSTFRVTATVTQESQIDLGATGPSLGDEIVFSGPLLQGANQVGHQGAVCTTVSLQGQQEEAQCIATYSFGGGQITAQALVILASPAPYEVAITGGTGKYEGATGEIHVLPATPTNPNGILTFHLQH